MFCEPTACLYSPRWFLFLSSESSHVSLSGKNCAEVCSSRLAELNSYVRLEVLRAELSDAVIGNFQVLSPSFPLLSLSVLCTARPCRRIQGPKFRICYKKVFAMKKQSKNAKKWLDTRVHRVRDR